jgi:hypothetical protein
VNIGDLVVMREGGAPLPNSFWLYGGEEAPWDENKRMIHTAIPFQDGEIGIVIGTVHDPVGRRIFHKLVTARGIGWVRELWLRGVK